MSLKTIPLNTLSKTIGRLDKVEKNIKIKMPHLIICEGIDAKKYMMYFLEHLIKVNEQFDTFQAIDVRGNEKFPEFFKTLPNMPKFSMVKSITIARDSEENPQGASQSLQASLKKGGFSVPTAPGNVACPAGKEHNVKVGYVLFPKINSGDTAGTLEDLCLNTLASPDKDKILEITDCAIESVKKQIGELKRPHKNRLHTYLSLTDDFVGLKLGEAANANAFDFCSNETKALEELLSAMLEEY